MAFADPVLGEPDRIVADDVLAFAGIAPPTALLYPVATHLAEKLHAYTLPRARPNTRVKDLPDIALLAQTKSLNAEHLRAAFRLTFSPRDTHPIPRELPSPPAEWSDPYERMARLDGLPWKQLSDLTVAVRTFIDPALSEEHLATWNPEKWEWSV